jgi:hypothetical protein
MALELTTANAAAGLKAEPVESELFGTRPNTGRPHSINLQPPTRGAASEPAGPNLDLLVAVGIGAAVMYYLDPSAGGARRARLRGVLVDAVSIAPNVFEDAAREVTAEARGLLPSASRPTGGAGVAPSADWAPSARLLAGALGTLLTFLGGRRRDALGAAVGVLGSALLARGMSAVSRGGSGNAAPAARLDQPAPPEFEGAVGA